MPDEELDHRSAYVHEYAEDVVEGRIVTSRLVRLACERHLRDLENGESRGIYFDESAAQIYLDFFGLLRHSKGEWAGRQFELSRWQQFIIGSVFGWLWIDSGFRRFKTAYVAVARKNGKTTLLSGIGLAGLLIDDEPGAEIYAVATKRDQARITFHEADRMVNSSPFLSRRISAFRNSLAVDATNSKFEPLGADSKTLDGLNTSMGLIDELHAHKSRDLYEVIDTSTGARRQPLMFSITTAGSDQTSFCYEQHEYCEKVLSGQVVDDSLFAYVASIDDGTGKSDPGDRWDDESAWIKANPNLGVSVKLEKLQEEVAAAKVSPRKQNAFRRLKLNQWTRADTRLLDLDRWDAAAGKLSPENIESANIGRPCWAGLDLSTTTDITAFVAVWPLLDEDEYGFDVACRFWIPADAIEDRVLKSRIPYDLWVDEGWVIATPGDVVDYREVRNEILDFSSRHRIEEVAFDRWGSQAVQTDLTSEGLTMVQFGQGYGSMSSPTKELEKLVLSASLRHGGNPVLRWMADNLEVQTDPADNWKPRKPEHKMSHKKIDGMVALIMALSRAMVGESHEELPSPYEERGILAL